jgi:hypothetical protein
MRTQYRTIVLSLAKSTECGYVGGAEYEELMRHVRSQT